MNELTARDVAQGADMIVRGYTFTAERGDDGRRVVRILNLEPPYSASLLALDGTVLESTMDDIELRLVNVLLAKNAAFLEPPYA